MRGWCRKAVNVMTGRKKQDESISSVFSIDGINTYFQSINTDPNYYEPEPIVIPEGTRIPRVEEITVIRALQNLKNTAMGPDEIPFWFTGSMETR